MMKQIVSVAILAVCVMYTSATEVNTCKSGLPIPFHVSVLNCEKGPCELPKGTSVYMNLTFDVPYDLEFFTPKIVAHALGIDVDYPLEDPEGCNQLLGGDSCPLEEGQRVLFGTSMVVATFYPNINFGIEMTLYSDNDEPITCFQIDGRVVNGF